jgi:hypothetical protein
VIYHTVDNKDKPGYTTRWDASNRYEVIPCGSLPNMHSQLVWELITDYSTGGWEGWDTQYWVFHGLAQLSSRCDFELIPRVDDILRAKSNERRPGFLSKKMTFDERASRLLCLPNSTRRCTSVRRPGVRADSYVKLIPWLLYSIHPQYLA